MYKYVCMKACSMDVLMTSPSHYDYLHKYSPGFWMPLFFRIVMAVISIGSGCTELLQTALTCVNTRRHETNQMCRRKGMALSSRSVRGDASSTLEHARRVYSSHGMAVCLYIKMAKHQFNLAADATAKDIVFREDGAPLLIVSAARVAWKAMS